MDRLLVVAMPEEVRLSPASREHVITGEGALNVIRALAGIDRDTPILNVGYVGSAGIPVGSRVRIGRVRLHHPNVTYDEPEFDLGGDVTCYTSCDFVTDAGTTEPCVFDMELAFILAMGFTDVVSEKVVSDSLDLDEFHKMIGGA